MRVPFAWPVHLSSLARFAFIAPLLAVTWGCGSSADRVPGTVTKGNALGAATGDAEELAPFEPPGYEVRTNPEINFPVQQDISLPLRVMVQRADGHARVDHAPPLFVMPPIVGAAPDSVVQPEQGVETVVPYTSSFGGITTSTVPDANASVGATQIVQAVNSSFAVYNKSGTLLLGPASFFSLFSGFGGLCETGTYASDPIVLYDKQAGRWIISVIAAGSGGFSAGGTECIAVSTSDDRTPGSPGATGTYARYAYDFTPNLNDYPKLAVWADGYYASYNMFNWNGTSWSFLGPKVCAYQRSQMLQGLTPAQTCFDVPNHWSLLPSDLDGPTLPPAGEPAFFLEKAAGNTSLNLYKFTVDWAHLNRSTFALATSIPVTSYGSCTSSCGVPEYGVASKLDTLADRLMFRLAYRNFGDHESLVANHTVYVTDAYGSRYGIRWYEIRDPNGSPTVYQQATFAPSDAHRWMGSIAMDGAGTIALGYSVSSTAMYPGVRFVGRLAGDPLGTFQPEHTLMNGSASLDCGANTCRWGDYTSMAIDPTDDRTFVYTNQYYAGVGQPRTVIGKFSYQDLCGSGLTVCNGQCVSLSSDPNNCGTCGHVCSAGATCCSGSCVSLSSDVNNCGSCGHVCPALVTTGNPDGQNHGTVSCVNSCCTASCNPGYNPHYPY